jgi:hypothetical protein
MNGRGAKLGGLERAVDAVIKGLKERIKVAWEIAVLMEGRSEKDAAGLVVDGLTRIEQELRGPDVFAEARRVGRREEVRTSGEAVHLVVMHAPGNKAENVLEMTSEGKRVRDGRMLGRRDEGHVVHGHEGIRGRAARQTSARRANPIDLKGETGVITGREKEGVVVNAGHPTEQAPNVVSRDRGKGVGRVSNLGKDDQGILTVTTVGIQACLTGGTVGGLHVNGDSAITERSEALVHDETKQMRKRLWEMGGAKCERKQQSSPKFSEKHDCQRQRAKAAGQQNIQGRRKRGERE